MVYSKRYLLCMFVCMSFPATSYANDRLSDTWTGQAALSPEETAPADASLTEPVYRRIDLDNQLRNAGSNGNLPTVLEFHVLNNEKSGYRLYENSGDYRNPNNQADRYGSCGGRVHNKDSKTGDYKRDTLGNIISFLGINEQAQFGATTNYAFYLDTAYINRGTGWIKPQYMLVVDSYIPDEEDFCNPETGQFEQLNSKYVIGRYMYNSAMYTKAIADSMRRSDGSWMFADKYYDADNGEGIPVSESSAASGYIYRKKNFNKVLPIKDMVLRSPNGDAYSHDSYWERPAFAWAIHKGDSLYVLKGADLEPAYKGAADDPRQLWLTLTKEYGEEDQYIDFARLINENIVPGSAWQEAYYLSGDGSYPEMRTYHDFKPVSALSPGKTIGLHAVIALDDNTHKDWVFSFRLIEKQADDFVIESEVSERNTAYGAKIRPGYGGWLKFLNGVPVITRSDENNLMADACVFNVNQASNPVSNEPICEQDATTEVTVVGGTGSVTILNAAGKKVIIRTMLGQVVAHIVVSSNNVSVPTPPGFAIVVIENKPGLKVIVK